MDLQGKRAIVTGGGVRIGRAIVLALAQAGCDVLLHYGQSAEPAAETANLARGYGVAVVTFAADLREPDAPQAIMDRGVAEWGHVDILINSAAVFWEEKDQFGQIEAAVWDTVMAINARAPFLLTQAFVSQLPAQTHGRVININDGRVPYPAPDMPLYRLAKRALWDMTPILAQQLAPYITVNTVALGAMLPLAGKSAAKFEEWAAENVLLQRTGSAEMVGQNVVHLLQQPFMTGAVLTIDGGEFL